MCDQTVHELNGFNKKFHTCAGNKINLFQSELRATLNVVTSKTTVKKELKNVFNISTK